MKKIEELLKYYIAFFRIGLLTIGGGYAMLPMLEKEVVEKNKWSTDEEVMDSYALAQSIPGIIAVNTAAFLGTKWNGFLGAVFAVLGIISPSIIIILIISTFFMRMQNIEAVVSAFKGIRIAVLALLIMSLIKMIKKSIKDWYGILLAILSFVFVVFIDVSPIIVIIAAALVSILIYYRKEKADDNS